MDNINLNNIRSRSVYYENIDKNKVYSFSSIDLLHSNMINKEILELKREEQIENKIRDILSDSKENIKNTVPIINNVNKQLMQDNLLMKIKIQNMKQSCKSISKYFFYLQQQAKEEKSKDVYNILNDISKKFSMELENIKEE